ncbi:MAG: hypothetical protein Q9187_009753, partial [Circinaria calcarea]
VNTPTITTREPRPKPAQRPGVAVARWGRGERGGIPAVGTGVDVEDDNTRAVDGKAGEDTTTEVRVAVLASAAAVAVACRMNLLRHGAYPRIRNRIRIRIRPGAGADDETVDGRYGRFEREDSGYSDDCGS